MPDIKISEVARLTGLSMPSGLECPSYTWQADLQNNIRRRVNVIKSPSQSQ